MKLAIILIIAAVFPVAAHLWSAWSYARARASAHWAQTRGTIVKSRVRWSENGSYPWVRYEYSVGGHRYASNRIRFGGGTMGSRSEAASWVDPYPVGGDVTVHYDPRKPRAATLERVASTNYFLMVGWALGSCVALFALYDHFSR